MIIPTVSTGYNVVEVNASDDRSPEIFRTQLEAATQMKAVMGAERRPNCLVLDEIDGAPSVNIHIILITYFLRKVFESKYKKRTRRKIIQSFTSKTM